MESLDDHIGPTTDVIAYQTRTQSIDSVINNNDHPQWELDINVPNCPKCSKKFSFFNRRHHCRKCGKIYCNRCCDWFTSYLPMSFVVFPPSEGGGFLIRGRLMHARFRTCGDCYEEIRMIKEAMGIVSESESDSESGSNSGSDNGSEAEHLNHRIINEGGHGERIQGYNQTVTGNNSIGKTQSQETTMETSDSIMINRVHNIPGNEEDDECPVCATSLKTMAEIEREMHINQCLKEQEFGSPIENTNLKRARNRMLISYLPNDGLPLLVNDDNECVICLEEFQHGDKVGRLECLCCFHYQCIKNWINKKGFVECPVHSLHV